MNVSIFIRTCFLISCVIALPMSTASAAKVGDLAPNFTLKSATGANLRLSEFRGEVVMINFWATWCGPCRQEMPVLEKLYSRYRDVGFELLGVSIDENSAKARNMAKRLKVNYPILFDLEKDVSELYDVDAMPTTVIVDRDGRVRHIYRGYLSGHEDKYQANIRGLLKE